MFGPWGVIRLLSSSSLYVLTEGDREVSSARCLLFVTTSWPAALPCILFSFTRAFLPGFISPWLLFVVNPYQFSPRHHQGRWRCLWLLSAALLCFSCHLFHLLLSRSFYPFKDVESWDGTLVLNSWLKGRGTACSHTGHSSENPHWTINQALQHKYIRSVTRRKLSVL